MQKIRLGIIGYGNRGKDLTNRCLHIDPDVEITAVCDIYEDRAKAASAFVEEVSGKAPMWTTDYRELLDSDNVDAVIIIASWEDHVPIANAAMKAGKYTALEVGGAYSIDDCYELVRTYEQTKTPFMFLENCCYGRREYMTLEMARKGLFGKIVHCSGSYSHDLRKEITDAPVTKHYRMRNYMYRNCDNYPTHDLGPIAKILGINRGNRMVSLVSVASKACGLHEYIADKMPDNKDLLDTEFRQGDVIDTIIRCAGGETIHLTLDTTLPRFYSRGYTVRGTKGGYFEDNDSVYLDEIHNIPKNEWNWRPNWGNGEAYFQEHTPAIWKKYEEIAAKTGHGGMDYMVLAAFFEGIRKGTPMPIDVYDAAAWMAISTLSEDSIACGGAPVAIPDFTRGKWVRCTKDDSGSKAEFALD